MSVPARHLSPHEPERAGSARGAPLLRLPPVASEPPLGPAPTRSPGRPSTAAPRIRRRKHAAGFAALATAVVGLMVLGIVTLNALLAQTSFRVDEVERRIDELSQEHLELVREQAQLSAPGRIAEWARRNGMRLPDDIRSLHASGERPATPAGAADTSAGGR